ncbi:MAG TPA: hypothetical protein VLJ38_07080 [Polyangiaceae bacterium]|nr:hypothetical protein [Polyangiaceae bacterium]
MAAHASAGHCALNVASSILAGAGGFTAICVVSHEMAPVFPPVDDPPAPDLPAPLPAPPAADAPLTAPVPAVLALPLAPTPADTDEPALPAAPLPAELAAPPLAPAPPVPIFDAPAWPDALASLSSLGAWLHCTRKSPSTVQKAAAPIVTCRSPMHARLPPR